MASIKKGARPGARSLPDHGTCLTGEPATDQTLFELAEVLAEIARDTVGGPHRKMNLYLPRVRTMTDDPSDGTWHPEVRQLA